MALMSQPWEYENSKGTTLASEPAPEPTRLIRPILYCRESFPPPDNDIGDIHAPPAIRLVEHKDVVLFPRNVVASQHTSKLLPPTFLRRRFAHHGGVMWNEEAHAYFLKSSDSLDVHTRVECPLYFADTDKPDVFGHVLLEALPRLWAAAKADKDTRFATSIKPHRNYDKLFTWLGVDPSRIVRIDRPVVSTTLLTPSLPVVRRTSVHPKAYVIFDKLRGLAKQGDIGKQERIYVSRSKVAGRDLVNELEVEAYFRSKDFFIVHPQDYSIENQIKLFTHAKLIASVGGSAAHSAVFAAENAKVLIISSSGWLVNADMLLSQVEGRLGYVFGEPIENAGIRRNKSAWRVALSDVSAATKQHFGI